MKATFPRALCLTASAVSALLLMGAGSGVKNGIITNTSNSPVGSVTSTATPSTISTMTSSTASRVPPGISSRVTGSPASRATSSVASRMTGSLASGITSSATGSRVKSGLTSSTTNSLSSSVTSSAMGTRGLLSPYAEEVARIIKFDRQALIALKEVSHGRIGRLIGFDVDGYQIMAPGVVVSVPEDRTNSILAALRQKLHPLHYMAFVVEINTGIKMDKIGVLKGTDQYEILRIMHTDGDDYDISNQDVIDWLVELERKAPFDIVGADSDWVEIEFKTLPKDLKAFAEEVHDFCPDAVDQGPGSVDGLAREIRKTNRLFLWWD